MTLEPGADRCGFVGLREDGFEGRIDVVIGNAAGAEFAGDAETSLAAGIGVLARVVEGVAGVVEVALFAEAGDHAINVSFVFGAASEILAHFVDGVRAAHQGAKGGGVKLLLAGDFARRRAGAHA